MVFLRIFIWLIIGIITAYVAQQRGRDPRIWLLIGLFLGIFGLLLVYFLPRVEVENKEPQIQNDEIEIFPLSVNEGEESASEFLPRNYRSKQWFYLTKVREQIGPLSFKELKEKWSLGILKDDDYVWCEEMPEWHVLSDLSLFAK